MGPADTIAGPGVAATGGIKAYTQGIAWLNGKTLMPKSHSRIYNNTITENNSVNPLNVVKVSDRGGGIENFNNICFKQGTGTIHLIKEI